MSAQDIRHSIDQFFLKDVSCLTTKLQSIEEILQSQETVQRDSTYECLVHAITIACQACGAIEGTIGEDLDLLADTRRQFREAIAPWFDKSPLMVHAKTKPRGYPGDYQMLNHIYKAIHPSPGVGGYLDLYFLDTELGRAVPARMEAVNEFLCRELENRSDGFSILDVACGPCEEFNHGRIPLPDDRDIRITFLDYDRDALAYVEKNVIEPRSDREHFQCIRYNALRMRSSERFIKQFGKFDIVYSVGLCDYISDDQLIPMLRGWREMTNENGMVYVAFKDEAVYDKNVYQWLVDWHFLQRSEEDCIRIMKEAGFEIDQMQVVRDDTGIIMNFFAAVGPTSHRRLDDAHETVKTPVHLGEAAHEKRPI